jgi:hypothetical protein
MEDNMKRKKKIVLKQAILVIRANGMVVRSKFLYEGDVRFDVNKHPCPYPGRPLPQDTFKEPLS